MMKRKKWAVFLTLLLVFLVPLVVGAGNITPNGEDVRIDSFLRPEAGPAAGTIEGGSDELNVLIPVAETVEEAGSRATGSDQMKKVFLHFHTKPMPNDIAQVRSAGGQVKRQLSILPALSVELPERAIENLKKNPRIKRIEPVLQARIIDPRAWDLNTSPGQGGLYQEELNNTWGVKRIGAGPVHLMGLTGTGVKVAVIDTGINYQHPEFSQTYRGGFSFVEYTQDPMDDHGHGTHVAGTIAAQRDGVGVVGASPGVELYALKTFDYYGNADFDDILAAMEWAVANGIQVINHSYGSVEDPGEVVKETFQKTYDMGILHIASAGNRGNEPGTGDQVEYPARYQSVIAVVATDSEDRRLPFSSTGPAIEIAAPGWDIPSAWAWFWFIGGNGVQQPLYMPISGTSMASPHVSGTAALVWAVNPGLSNIKVRQIMQESAENLGHPTEQQGYGLVRAERAVARALPTQPGKEFSLNMESRGQGLTIPDEGKHMYQENTTVLLTAIPKPGWKFSHWNGQVGDRGNPQTYVYMDEDKTIQAVFDREGTGGTIYNRAHVYTDRDDYPWNSWVQITVQVEDPDGTAVPAARLVLRVFDPAGAMVECITGTTGTDGNASFRFRVKNRVPTGDYVIRAGGAEGMDINEGEKTITVMDKQKSTR